MEEDITMISCSFYSGVGYVSIGLSLWQIWCLTCFSTQSTMQLLTSSQCLIFISSSTFNPWNWSPKCVSLSLMQNDGQLLPPKSPCIRCPQAPHRGDLEDQHSLPKTSKRPGEVMSFHFGFTGIWYHPISFFRCKWSKVAKKRIILGYTHHLIPSTSCHLNHLPPCPKGVFGNNPLSHLGFPSYAPFPPSHYHGATLPAL